MQTRLQNLGGRLNDAIMNPERAAVILKGLNKELEEWALRESECPRFYLLDERYENHHRVIAYWRTLSQMTAQMYNEAANQLTHFKSLHAEVPIPVRPRVDRWY